ncbi:hypothetical protein SASPL_124340 [Salvia splendens]|uniref:Cytochrome P450 n=1 Tax=Salvia splendens TaxID=180675 RepID=A0A8X8XPU8_SALSN|nr:hypothetical protein SASPL_124340 [Salvia splendens]
MSGGKLPHIALGAMADKHGPIFEIRLGVRQALVVSDAKLAKELFTKCDLAVSSRPETASSRNLGYEMAMFGFAPYGQYWREVRKVVSTELLSARRLELQKHVLVSETDLSINELFGVWSQKANVAGRVSVEMKQWFGDLNLNTVLRMVVGKRCFGSGGGDIDEARRCQRVMRDFFHLAGVFVVGDIMPYLRWLDVGGYEKKMKETSKELDLLVGQWLEEHREREILDKGKDFMDVMLCVVRASLLQAFDISTPNGEEVDMSESGGLTNGKATPLDVLVSPRLCPSLY